MVTREVVTLPCVLHRALHHCPALSGSAGTGSSIQGTLDCPARLSVLPGQKPWEGFHTNSNKAKAEQLMDEISSVRSVAVRASLGGGFCSFAAAASCLVSKDRASDKSWEEAGGSAMKLFPMGGGG